MAYTSSRSSSSSDNEVYDDSFCSKSCRKNTENLNNKIIKLNEELSDCETNLYNYERGLSQVEARLVEFKNNKIKLCERIRVLERDVELKDNIIENLRNELEELKKEKESIDHKLAGFGLPEFIDDTVTDYSRPTPSIDVSKDVSDEQKAISKSNSASFSEQGGSVGNVVSKPMIRFVKETGYPSVSKVNNTEKSRKPTMNVEQLKEGESSLFNRITHPNPKRNMIPQAILMRSGRKTINVANPKAVHNVVKASACWVWKPKNKVIDHVSKYNNASMTLKRFDYIDAQGRFKRYGLGLILYRAPCAIKGVLRKNTENLNNKIIKLNEELSDCETDLYNYKRGLSQVEARLVEFKNNEIKFCERIRVLERDLELRDNKIENLRNELEEVKKEKESIDFKIEKFDNASKDLDSLLGNKRLDKDKKGLGFNEYSVVPPPPAQVYSPPKKDLSWMGLPEFVDDTVTDYSRPTPSIDVPRDMDAQTQGRHEHMIKNLMHKLLLLVQKLMILLLKLKCTSKGVQQRQKIKKKVRGFLEQKITVVGEKVNAAESLLVVSTEVNAN
ncbi:hypothetical protein Tco_1232631 [Tanacetum coccineum]